MKALFFICLAALLSIKGFAISAYPYLIPQVVNGKVFYIRLLGDEHRKWAETEDGYTIVRNANGQWCYAKLDNDSILSATSWTIDTSHHVGFENFIKSVPKHLRTLKSQHKRNILSQRTTKQAIGERRILVILMSYKNLPFTKTKSDFDNLFNQEGYGDDHAQGSVRDFYLSSSYNQLLLTSDIYGPYTTSNVMSYYGKNTAGSNGNDANPYQLFLEAIDNVSHDADLQLYDGDGDGFIDNVHIIFAGYGEEAGASSDAIWSHEATFYRPYEINGLKIDRYSCAPELRGNSGNGISRIGPHCHEIGHALGAMDYYDTDYSAGGEYSGTGKWDVMASGSWNNDGVTPADFNPYVKAYNFGWITPKPLPQGEVTILPSNANSQSYYLLKSSEYGDYYMLENRSRTGWGGGLPGEGLLFYHIHSDIANAGNEINISAPQMCYVVCASSKSKTPNRSPASYGDINTDGCPYPGRTGNRDFGQKSTPQAFYWNNDECGIEINNIAMKGDGSIALMNNSTATDYEPLDMRIAFFEGFENEPTIISGNGSTLWRVVENPENTQSIIDKPVAYEGVRSLQLSTTITKVDTSDTLEFRCKPFDYGKKRIKICVASLHLRFNKPNVVKVGYRTTDNPDWQYTEILSAENNRWRQTFVDLPDNVDVEFKIVGTAFGGSILAIDNIEIEQEKEAKGDDHICNAKVTTSPVSSIYSISGQRRHTLRPGLNIIISRTDHHRETKKIFVKE